MGKIKLKSRDGEVIIVDQKVANMSMVVKTMTEQLGEQDDDSEPVELNNVSGPILRLVLKWCQYHKDDVAPPQDPAGADDDDTADKRYLQEIPTWDADFLKVDQTTLFELIVAANYLDIKQLLDLTCQAVANMIKSKTPEEIRKTFNIEKDFSEEEEAKIKKENEWVEEK